MSKFDKGLSLFLAVAIVVAIGGIVYLATIPKPGDRFTEFYVLGSKGKASDYPREIILGNPTRVTLGVVNHEGSPATYRVKITIDGIENCTIDVGVLADCQKWEQEVSFTPQTIGERKKVEFYLYRNGGDRPYHKDPLRLYVNVIPPVVSP